jgi:transposase
MLAGQVVCFHHGVFFLSGWPDSHPDFQTLDARLSADHLARRIHSLVQLLDLGPLFRSYKGCGSAPFCPALLLEAALYELHRETLSPADWTRHATENGPLRWLLRGLEPSRPRWYAFRDRLADFHHDLNRQILQLGFDLQLTTGEKASLDGSAVAALGSRRRLDNRKSLAGKSETPEGSCYADAVGVPLMGLLPYWMAKTPRGRMQQLARFRRANEVLQERLKENQARRACDRVPDKQVRVCASEPEAALGRDKEGVYRPLYNEQILRDLSSELVLGYGVLAQAGDCGTMEVMVGHYQNDFDGRLRELLADGAYATGPQASLMERWEITLYAPSEPPVSHKGQIPKTQFAFFEGEQEQECYVCPEGKNLPLAQTRRQQRAQGERVQLKVFQASKEDCSGCQRRQACCGKSKNGRTISRSEHEGALERLRGRMATEQGKAAYKKRKQTVELAFADQKEHRGLRRFRSRGRRRAECQVGLLVLVHNGLIVVKALSQAEQPPTEPSPTS